MSSRQQQKRFSLYLINPKYRFKHYAAQQEISEFTGKRSMTVPLQLPLIAALTPDHYDIRIINDETEPPEALPLPDLVGITVISATSGRAFEIADFYRSKQIPVVFGGPLASFRTDECLAHADHVVVGEAEGAWQKLLADFERGETKSIYKNDDYAPFRTSPIPRWDLVDAKEMMSIGVETSRGCVFKCNFCVVNNMFGSKMRFREVDDVVAEIESLPVKRLFFVSDNFAVNKRYAKELVSRLKSLDITWICQTSIDIAKDDDLLEAMAEAGCISILIGFESLNDVSLQDIEKHHNRVADFERAIAKVHDHGIHVHASFIVGFDGDTTETFDYIYDFMTRNHLVYSMLNVLSAAPGTELFKKLTKEGRIHCVAPSYRNGIFPCMRYRNMSQSEMLDRFFATLEKLFSWEEIAARAVALFERGTFLRGGRASAPFTEKVAITLRLLRHFLFSRDKVKRQLFIRLFRLVRAEKLSMNDLVIFLLNMEGFHRFIVKSRTYLPEVRRAVAAVDEEIAREEAARLRLPMSDAVSSNL